jgi:hypothetical protein
MASSITNNVEIAKYLTVRNGSESRKKYLDPVQLIINLLDSMLTNVADLKSHDTVPLTAKLKLESNLVLGYFFH